MSHIYEKMIANPKTVTLFFFLLLLFIIIVFIVGYYAWQHHTAEVVTYEKQIQAQTAEGIELAAKVAHIEMLESQLKDASGQITELANKPPEKVIVTVPYEVEKTVVKEVAAKGADFAIVTDSKDPEKEVNIKEITKLPENTPVTLNQYNVFAYKKVIRGINVYPSFNGIKPTGIGEITGDVSRKISNDGKYIGIVGGYDFDNKKVKIGLRVTF
ncbi:hypothetical protein [Pelosinus sp. sgz500959]|uniref:hypothetical protein n=1 Tax=Pelosinus sp. sgz500959 TaxID=3242472 RepID=UPI00366E3783